MRQGSKKLFNHVGTIHQKHVIELLDKFLKAVTTKIFLKALENQGSLMKHGPGIIVKNHQKPLIPVMETISITNMTEFQPYEKTQGSNLFRINSNLKGPKTKQNVQVGNAVPPILGKVLATKIKKYLDEAD